jgi:hypothetical protein
LRTLKVGFSSQKKLKKVKSVTNLFQSGSLTTGLNPSNKFSFFGIKEWKPGLIETTVLLSIAVILVMVLGNIGVMRDYVGKDNDDVMRLVEVRDLLAGQSWFDMHQYRLGLEGGTLMHWSRFIDAPIALLIMFFSLFMSPSMAEIAGVSTWPLLLVAPFIWATGLGGQHLGGRPVMILSQLLATIFVLMINRFHPGSIDHHNMQMVLVLVIVTMLMDKEKKGSSYAIAGFASALALAIGAETTPLLAIVAIVVATLWGIFGISYRKAATSYGLSFATFSLMAFFATTPAGRLTAVTCDNLSFAFAGLAGIGGFSLALSAMLYTGKLTGMRLLMLGVTGALVSSFLLTFAPQCLHNPLDSLDPLLHTLWLSSVTEAQSIVSEFKNFPETIGLFYAPGVLAMVVCLLRIIRKEMVTSYSILFVLIAVSTAIACYQIRAAIFANVIAMLPLSALIADLQASMRADPKNQKKALAFVVVVLASIPAFWGISGILIKNAIQDENNRLESELKATKKMCRDETDFQQLASLPTGLVASASDTGAHILRYTQNRALSAPYHRNPDGMLIQLKIGLAPKSEAETILRNNNVNYYVVCDTNTEEERIAKVAPAGMAAGLIKGIVPDFLEKLPKPAGSNLTVYVVRPASS